MTTMIVYWEEGSYVSGSGADIKHANQTIEFTLDSVTTTALNLANQGLHLVP